MPWRDRGPALWPAMHEAFDSLRAEHELVVLEGAGSPAEINLPDLVNNRMVEHADAAALLVADIDRGGAFAHLFGTWSLVPDATRERLAGFVLNRFRGDAALLAPGPERLTELTGMACAGVVPMVRHELPDEEGATVRADPGPGAARVAVLRFPYGSNLDELHLLARAARVTFAEHPADLEGADLVILPGSKHVAADLGVAARPPPRRGRPRVAGPDPRHLRRLPDARALRSTTRTASRAGGRGGSTGLGLLPFDTVLAGDKVTAHRAVRVPRRPARRVGGAPRRGGGGLRDPVRSHVGRGRRRSRLGGREGLATTVHGLLEDPDVVDRLVGRRPPLVLEETFDLLADAVDAHLDTALLRRLTS